MNPELCESGDNHSHFIEIGKCKIKKRGLFHAYLYLVIAICSAGFIMLKIRNFRINRSHLACSMRKLVINKYLALLARLSIDTTQLHYSLSTEFISVSFSFKVFSVLSLTVLLIVLLFSNFCLKSVVILSNLFLVSI